MHRARHRAAIGSAFAPLALAAIALAAPPAAATSTVAPTKGANGTTLPFQRHLVRMGSATAPTLVAAVQKQGAGGDGLTLYLSKDGGNTWSRDQAVQPQFSIRDTSDLVADPDGSGFFLLYSVEPVSSRFGSYPGSDVVLLHYSLLPDGTLGADAGPLVLFHPGSGQGYFRASLTRDSAGILHCAATFFDGAAFSFLVRLSADDGLNWQGAFELANFGATEGGGRVIAVGDRVAAVFDDYAPSHPGRLRLRPAGASGSWGPTASFAADGLYHGGAFSIVATPDGHLHLGYSEKAHEQLRYREFDGTSWSAPITFESVGWWANQPALSNQGNDVSYVWNHKDGTSSMRIFQRRRTGGVWGAAQSIDTKVAFKGYTNAIETVAAGERVQLLWSEEQTLNVSASFIRSASAQAP